MTSIKFHYRPTIKEGAKQGKLFIRIIHRRRSCTITTPYVVEKHEWDQEREAVIVPSSDSDRNTYLSGIATNLLEDKQRLEKLILQLGERGEYDVEDIAQGFKGNISISNHTVTGFCQKACLRLEAAGQERTARAYRSAVKSFQNFRKERILTLSDLNVRTMKAYECYLLEKGLSLNTVSFYMRQLRAIYYRAVKEKLIRPQEDNPFANVYTGVCRTKRRALSEEQLNSLAAVELQLDHHIKAIKEQPGKADKQTLNFYFKLKQSLLLFLFCFHARGMSFVDMAYLKKSDVGENTIVYKRKKTGRFLEIGITRPMREIMEWFSIDAAHNGSIEKRMESSPYVFPVMDLSKGNLRKQYENGLHRQNQFLSILSGMANLDKKVTTHVSRHTWATLAKRHQVSVGVISEALGHRDTRTTEHYLASFDQSVLDKLSMQISGVIKKGKKAA